jgi:hypothetical protein
MTLEEEERVLEQQLETLQREERVLNLRRQVDALRTRRNAGRLEEDPHPIAAEEGPAFSDHVGSAASSNRRRMRDAGDEPQDTEAYGAKKRRTHIQVPPPRNYTASSFREYTQYIRNCEQHFEVDPEGTGSDKDKALFIRVYSEGDAQNRIYRMLEAAGDNYPTWDEIKHFLKDLLAPERERNQDAAHLYYSARQRMGQSVSAFVTHLESLEEGLPESSDEVRCAHLKQALRPDLLMEILPQASQPTTRAELIDCALRAEQVIKLRSKVQREGIREMPFREGRATERPTQSGRSSNARGWREHGSRPGRSRNARHTPTPQFSDVNQLPVAQTGHTENAQPTHAPRDKSNDTCNYCLRKGHWESACRDKAAGKQRAAKALAQ